MKRVVHRLVLSASLATLPPGGANAGGIPVIDTGNIAKAVLQLEQMKAQYQRQFRQLEQATRQADAMTGTRNMGHLHNAPSDQKMRRALPSDIDALLDPSSGTFGASAQQVRTMFHLLQEQYQPVATEEFGYNATLPWHQSYEHHSTMTHSSLAASHTSYNNVAPRMATYEAFLAELNSTQDVKATADLQARIAVENGILMNEMIRLLSLQIQQKAAADNAHIGSVRSLHQARQPLPTE
jgi:type IV secretion system protein VirB5